MVSRSWDFKGKKKNQLNILVLFFHKRNHLSNILLHLSKLTLPFLQLHMANPTSQFTKPWLNTILHHLLSKRTSHCKRRSITSQFSNSNPPRVPKHVNFYSFICKHFNLFLDKNKIIFRQPQHEFLNILLFIIDLQFQLLQSRLFYISIIFSLPISSTSTILYIHNRILYNKNLI